MSFFKNICRKVSGSRMTLCAGLAAAALLTAGAGSVKHITLFVDGQQKQLVTMHSQPEKIISEAGVAMGDYDEFRMSSLRVKDNTEIFIYPPYKFRCVDGLITNFHLPKSTLVMLVSAFCSREKVLDIYKTAVENKYRFFSFGDACLFL